MGIQEPHIADEAALYNLHTDYAKRDLVLLSNTHAKGRGGAAIAYRSSWEHLSSWTWSGRFMFVKLKDTDGLVHDFAICHFNHDAAIRRKQWDDLANLSHLIPASTVFLSDHNLVILPSRDVLCPRNSPQMSDVMEARQKELSFISMHCLIDSYVALHEGHLDDLPLEGWTWGFPPTHDQIGKKRPNQWHHIPMRRIVLTFPLTRNEGLTVS